jgi:hypothetical protein
VVGADLAMAALRGSLEQHASLNREQIKKEVGRDMKGRAG